MMQSDQFRFYLKEVNPFFLYFLLQLTELFKDIEGFEKVVIIGFL